LKQRIIIEKPNEEDDDTVTPHEISTALGPKVKLFDSKLQQPTVDYTSLHRNKASYFRKKSNISHDSKVDKSEKNRKPSSEYHLDVKSGFNRYKKLKSPTEAQSDSKKLEKAFRAIAMTNISHSNTEMLSNIHNVSIKQNDIKAYFAKRYGSSELFHVQLYPKKVSEVLLNYIRFNGTIMKFEEYCENLEKLLALREYEKFKI
jgi:hypothetical protein